MSLPYELLEFAADENTYCIQIRMPKKSMAQIVGISRIITDILEAEFPSQDDVKDRIGFRSPVESSEELFEPEYPEGDDDEIL